MIIHGHIDLETDDLWFNPGYNDKFEDMCGRFIVSRPQLLK